MRLAVVAALLAPGSVEAELNNECGREEHVLLDAPRRHSLPAPLSRVVCWAVWREMKLRRDCLIPAVHSVRIVQLAPPPAPVSQCTDPWPYTPWLEPRSTAWTYVRLVPLAGLALGLAPFLPVNLAIPFASSPPSLLPPPPPSPSAGRQPNSVPPFVPFVYLCPSINVLAAGCSFEPAGSPADIGGGSQP